ncbi:MAG: 6-phosphofructokinase, partial [Candidatus Saganbacteria bacterium]|nr:6-phosphofructokinase [Candidatus Saganbacteria bacterium]
ATIDNDVPLTDFTIGVDPAVNTAQDCIDKIRDTAASHERVFIVEVMGREHGFIALEVGLTSGAEIILVPEVKFTIKKLCEKLKAGLDRGKLSSIVVMAEGVGDSREIGKQIKNKMKIDVRVTVLGHIQRGGSPTALSRKYACKLGAAAVELLIKGEANRMVGIKDDKVVNFDIEEVLKHKKTIDLSDYKLAEILAI